jgi:hypothetical protein
LSNEGRAATAACVAFCIAVPFAGPAPEGARLELGSAIFMKSAPLDAAVLLGAPKVEGK